MVCAMSHKARLLTAPVSRLLVNNRSFRLESTCVCYRVKRIKYNGCHPAAFILCRVTSRTQRARCTWIRAAAFFAGWLPLLLHPALRLSALGLANSRWDSFTLCGSASTLRLPKGSYDCWRLICSLLIKCEAKRATYAKSQGPRNTAERVDGG